MSKRIAITGGIACGKSLFSRYLSQAGVEILDADDVVHRLEAPGGEAVARIVAAFGEEVRAADGGIDRVALGARVFSDAAARSRLNEIVHPLVKAELMRWLDEPARGLRAVVIPLLFEVGWNTEWDVIVCLVADEALQCERLMRDRGLTEVQARQRIAAQMPVAEKAARAHVVVRNDGDAEALGREAARVQRYLTERCG